MQPNQNDEAKIHRELYNRSRDIIAVGNPTEKDFRLVYDQRLYIIPSKNRDIGFGNGKAQLSQYLAKKYCKEMCDKLLTEKAKRLVEEENNKRAQRGASPLTHFPGDNSEETIESQVMVNSKEERLPVMRTLWLGLVQKSPDDLVLSEGNKRDTQKTVDDEVFGELGNVKYNDSATPSNAYVQSQVTSNINAKKEALVESLSQPTNETQIPNI